MISELHCHTSEYSACSHVNAVELITRAYNLGLQGIVITDHHYQWNDQDLVDIKKEAGLPEIFNVLAGQEFKTSNYGDVLVYGVKNTIQKQKMTLEELREKHPDAAIIWAHPYRHDKIPKREKLLNPLLDGIEIFSSNYTVTEASRALKDWHELKYTAIAGTDTHALSYTGTYPTIFDHPFSTIEGLVKELKAGRCRPYFKETPRIGTTDTEITELSIGPKSSKERKEVIVKSYKDKLTWKDSERTHKIMEGILNNGFESGKYRVPKPLDKDEKNLSLIEEQIKGDTLFDKIINADEEQAHYYLRLAARWLSKFHNKKLEISPKDEYLSIEKERLDYYISRMINNKHSHLQRIKLILEEVWKHELELLTNHKEVLVQGHGDFHPKNIFLGKDKVTGEEYIAAIDFNSSYQLPKAFDTATFIAQYKNMFFENSDVNKKAPVDIFLSEYVERAEDLSGNFYDQVELYKARSYLSVLYYLEKVGKGESENFWTILVEAERCLAHRSFSTTFK